MTKESQEYMYILHEGNLVDSLDIEDPNLADIEVQVLAWLRELLRSEWHADTRDTPISVPT